MMGSYPANIMISNMSLYYGEELMILRLEGCANVIGFWRFISRSMKLVAERDVAKTKINSIVRKIISEVKAIPNVLNR